jgi:Rrf2 family transcriptional regulator, iron-sulfur cluster assembly transcription factor
MFKISRKTEYAIRGMMYLARNQKGEFIMLRQIGNTTKASQVFLAKIFQTLSNAHLVESSRGAVGGFRLARNPEKITLKDIIEATEGPIQINVCIVDSKACDFSEACSAHVAWQKVRSKLDVILSEITLSELALERA